MAKPRFTIYRKVPCAYCEAAEKLLAQRGIPYQDVDLTGREGDILALKERFGHYTVPIILFDDKLLGGYNELVALDRLGQLKVMMGT